MPFGELTAAMEGGKCRLGANENMMLDCSVIVFTTFKVYTTVGT